jgi:hypothetical protein
MAATIDFIQIYYKQEHKEYLYDFAKPYFSAGLTPYFENAIIAGVVPTCEADYISVCSWRLKKKRGDSIHYLGGFGTDQLTMDKIQAAMPFDVAILTPRSPNHQVLSMAANWHGHAWADAFKELKPFFGKIPDELTYAIYENHFIARKEIYHDYVKSFLIPAIELIGDNPVFFADSGYLQKKKDYEEIARVQKLLGRKDWPILPFILERLFSFYINDKGFNVIKL